MSKKAHLVGIEYEIVYVIYRVSCGSREMPRSFFISVTRENRRPKYHI